MVLANCLHDVYKTEISAQGPAEFVIFLFFCRQDLTSTMHLTFQLTQLGGCLISDNFVCVQHLAPINHRHM